MNVYGKPEKNAEGFTIGPSIANVPFFLVT